MKRRWLPGFKLGLVSSFFLAELYAYTLSGSRGASHFEIAENHQIVYLSGMKHTQFLSLFLALCVAFSGLSCGSSTESLVESARFHMDRYEYEEALEIGERALRQDPSSREAGIVVALALVGIYYLGKDRTNLAFMANILEGIRNGKGIFPSFLAAAHSDTAVAYVRVTRAQDLLLLIPEEGRNFDVYLEIYLIRLFEMALALDKVGAYTEDLVCNADPSISKRDLVPDGLRPQNLTAAEVERFRNNLRNTWRDAAKAGLDPDFEITRQIKEASNALESAVAAASGDVGAAVGVTVQTAFGDTGTTEICDVD